MAAKTTDSEITVLTNQVEAEGPFTAMGFFEVQKSTLTALISTVITYLLVMIQFSQSDQQDKVMPAQNITNGNALE